MPTSGEDVVERDYLILGAGPGGIQLASFLASSGCSHLVLEGSDGVGAFFRTMPRTRKLISFNKVHSIYDDPEIRLRWDWNSLLTDDYAHPFREFSQDLYPDADDLVRYLEAFAERSGMQVETGARITRVRRLAGGGFELHAESGRIYRGKVLVVATGFSTPYVPDIPGIEHCEGYEDAPLDPQAYLDQRLLILGKGNSALEIADVALETAALIHVASPTPVQLAWKTRHPGHLRAQHTRLLDLYQLKTLTGALDCEILDITREPGGTDGPPQFVATVSYVHADGETEELVYDRVVRCTGFAIDRRFYDADCTPDTVLDGRLPSISGMWESTNVPGMFFAGTLMQGLDFKRSSSAFIDGFRYNVRTLHRYLMERFEGRPMPVARVPRSADALTQHILERVCRTSALWTQFGYLCDLFVVGDAGEVTCQEELPLKWVEDQKQQLEHSYTLTFEWGNWEGDVFAIQRHPSAEGASTNVFLHPILRRYCRGELVETHHILEDLFGTYSAATESGIVRRRSGRDIERYHAEEHTEPLRAFLASQLGGVPTTGVREEQVPDS